MRVSLRLLQNALIELEKRELPIDVQLRRLEICVVHAAKCGVRLVTV